MNVAVVEPASTVTEVGVVRSALLLDSATRAPPAGARVESVTVQLLDVLGPRLTGLQTSEETTTAARLIVAGAALLL